VTYGYDGHGRLTTTTDSRTGTVTTQVYDSGDRVVTNKVEASGLSALVTVLHYDVMGRVWRTVQPDGTSVTNEFTVRGELKKASGSRTYPIEYAYDAQGRMTNMTTWRDHASGAGVARTSWTFDAYRGHLASKQYADGWGPAYSHDAAGRLTGRTWVRGTSVAYEYSGAGDLMEADYSDGTPDLTYTRDRLGRVTQVAQTGLQTVEYLYGPAGEPVSERHGTGPLAGLTVSNRYDGLLRRTTNGIWNGSAWVSQIRHTYDGAGRLSTVGDGTNSATYGYLASSSQAGQITLQSNGVVRLVNTRSFDNLNRTIGVMGSNGVAGAISRHGYQYNAAQQRTAVTNADNSRWVYTYDALGQVVSGRRYWHNFNGSASK
jgi:YD repeat-containing protein